MSMRARTLFSLTALHWNGLLLNGVDCVCCSCLVTHLWLPTLSAVRIQRVLSQERMTQVISLHYQTCDMAQHDVAFVEGFDEANGYLETPTKTTFSNVYVQEEFSAIPSQFGTALIPQKSDFLHLCRM